MSRSYRNGRTVKGPRAQRARRAAWLDDPDVTGELDVLWLAMLGPGGRRCVPCGLTASGCACCGEPLVVCPLCGGPVVELGK